VTAAFFQVAKDVINEFAADGVKYLELRSTPREEVKTGEARSHTQGRWTGGQSGTDYPGPKVEGGPTKRQKLS